MDRGNGVTNRTWLRVGLSIGCALLGPFVLMSGYLLLTRGTALGFSEASDYAALCASVVGGMLPIAVLPMPKWAKVTSAIIYAPLLLAALFGYTFGFVCGVFNNCL